MKGKENIMPELFKTTDLLLATILKTKGFQLKNWRTVYVRDRKKMEFYFEDSEELREEVRLYWTTDYEPFKRFWRNLKELKALIYATEA